MVAIHQSGLFDEGAYLSQCPSLGSGRMLALEHYIEHGGASELQPNAMFDNKFYLASNPDVAAARLNPLFHFIKHGSREGRAPHPLFNTDAYLAAYPDVKAAGIDPLWHHLQHGQAEGRNATNGSTTDRTKCGVTGHPPKLATNPECPLPVARVSTLAEWDQFVASELFNGLMKEDVAVLASFSDRETWNLDGYSDPAGEFVSFYVDAASGGHFHNGCWTPNIRERLVCPISGLNNRQRLIASVARQAANKIAASQIYMMEEITPFSAWLKQALPNTNIVGSEYLGPQYHSGETVLGIRHEDVTAMSFPDSTFDLIISNDVMEHVPTPEKGFTECARVLRPGGLLLMTIPFTSSDATSVTRAQLGETGIDHLLPPVFHGNPVSAEGSLVFTDYGWDVIDMMERSGFENAAVEFYHSMIHGHLGKHLLIFRAQKPA